MSRWKDFYKDRLNTRYEEHIDRKYREFIDIITQQIIEYNNQGKVPLVVELGCGICSITKALIKSGANANYVALDNDLDMLKLAETNINKLYPQIPVQLHLIDIRRSINFLKNTADIVHSHGVLEHMQDNDINDVLNNWPDQRHFHYVPSFKYENPSFGDERLMNKSTWEKITRSWVIEFNNGFDYILIR